MWQQQKLMASNSPKKTAVGTCKEGENKKGLAGTKIKSKPPPQK
jgi:hypothetical protein